MTTSSNDTQAPKATLPIDVTDAGIVMRLNDEHRLKATLPIDLIDVGI